jgi:serine/threonine protein phosphatase PrpC
VPHEDIRTVLGTHGTPAEVADDLVTSALNQGGLDNVTVCIIDVVS